MVRMILLIVVALAGASLDAFAQPPPAPSYRARFFIGAGIAAEADNTSTSAAPIGSALTASAGLDVSRHFGVRVTLEVPKTYSTESPSSTFGFFRTRSTAQYRSICWSVLVDGHRQLTPRVRLGLLGGITVAHRPFVYLTSTDQLGAGDVVIGHVDTTRAHVFTWSGFTGGVELPVALTNHFLLVPGATVTMFPMVEYGGSAIVRGGAAVRWRF